MGMTFTLSVQSATQRVPRGSASACVSGRIELLCLPDSMTVEGGESWAGTHAMQGQHERLRALRVTYFCQCISLMISANPRR